jgi:hypothetical protein
MKKTRVAFRQFIAAVPVTRKLPPLLPPRRSPGLTRIDAHSLNVILLPAPP